MKGVLFLAFAGQGIWEWEDGSPGSADWKPYGAKEAAQLKQSDSAFKSSPQSDPLAPPAYWSPQTTDGVVKYFDVKLDSREGMKLVTEFRKTANDSDFDIVKIERVQNLALVGVFTHIDGTGGGCWH